jgi:AraC-like DNA-binding protein
MYSPVPTGAAYRVSDFPGRPPVRRVAYEDPMIAMLLSGDGGYWLDGHPVPLDRPTVLFIPPGVEICNTVVTALEFWWAMFQWRGVRFRKRPGGRFSLEWRRRKFEFPLWKPVDGKAMTEIAETMSALREHLATGEITRMLHARSLTMRLIALYMDLPGPADATIGNRALDRYHKLLQKHALKPVPISAIAAKTGYSPKYIGRLFRRRYGMRPTEFRNRMRIDRARELLMTTDLSVKQVAYKTGFSDPLYFSRLFKRYVGVSPRELIRRFRIPPI